MAWSAGRPWRTAALGIGGAGLLLAAAGVHLDLYLTGYRNIPAIGPLFLVQVALATLLAVAVVATATGRSRSITAPVAAAAAVFAFGTIAAYAMSRVGSLFGFHEHATTAGIAAGLIEVGAFTALGLLAGHDWGERLGSASTAAHPEASGDRGGATPARRHRGAQLLALGATAAALLALVLATGTGSPSSPSSSGHSAANATSPRRVVHVVISNFAFHPARVVARPGAIVAVTNKDQVAHTMTAVPGSAPFGGFNTGSVGPGQTVRIKAPEAEGRYDFYCSIHKFMKGVLVVSG